jgi:hypothetical protein
LANQAPRGGGLCKLSGFLRGSGQQRTLTAEEEEGRGEKKKGGGEEREREIAREQG